MGFTHYWLRPSELEREKFAAAVGDCRKVCEASGIPLRGIEGAAEPVFQDRVVAFDGGCESFIVQRACTDGSPERPSRSRPGNWFGYCKTERLPYDLCVQAALVVLEHHLGAAFRVSSDGDSAAWDSRRSDAVKIYFLRFRDKSINQPDRWQRDPVLLERHAEVLGAAN